MTKLSSSTCEACSAGAQALSTTEQRELLVEVPGWALMLRDGVPQLERSFTFDNFSQALEFTNAVGALAETQGHHPALLTEWGKVTVTWWSHTLKGLHRNDFVMAARTSETADLFRPS